MIAMVVPLRLWAQDETQCPTQLKDTRYQLSITDNQRALAVRDLGQANRIIEEYRVRLDATQKELAKLKADTKKPEEKAK